MLGIWFALLAAYVLLCCPLAVLADHSDTSWVRVAGFVFGAAVGTGLLAALVGIPVANVLALLG